MNTSAKGRSYEWAARHELERLGNSVLRSAASKGPFDLVAWNVRKIGFFQLKAGRYSCAAADRAVTTLPRPPYASVAVVHECRRGCKRPNHVPRRFCMHERLPVPHDDVRTATLGVAPTVE